MLESGLDGAPTTIWEIILGARQDPSRVPYAQDWIARTYAPRIRSYALRKLRGDECAADDAVQEVFLAVMQPGFLAGLDPRLSFRKLLKVITFRKVMNVGRDRRRRAKAEPPVALEELLAAEADPEGVEFDRAWVKAVLAEAIRGLGKNDRAWWRSVAEGRGSIQDVVQRFSITKGAAAKRAHDARKRLWLRIRAIVSRDFVSAPRADDIEVELDELGVDRILEALLVRRDGAR